MRILKNNSWFKKLSNVCMSFKVFTRTLFANTTFALLDCVSSPCHFPEHYFFVSTVGSLTSNTKLPPFAGQPKQSYWRNEQWLLSLLFWQSNILIASPMCFLQTAPISFSIQTEKKVDDNTTAFAVSFEKHPSFHFLTLVCSLLFLSEAESHLDTIMVVSLAKTFPKRRCCTDAS